MTKELIRAAGGIVHADGNIFFTNQTQLDEYARAAIQQAAGCEHLRGDVGSRWCALAEKPAASAHAVPWTVDIDNDYKPPRLRLTVGVQSFTIHVDYTEEEPGQLEWYRDMLTKAMLAASPAPPKQQPALGRGEGGGVPLSDDAQMRVVFEESYNMALERLALARAFIPASLLDKFEDAWRVKRESLRQAPRPSAPTGQINPDSAGQGMEGGE